MRAVALVCLCLGLVLAGYSASAQFSGGGAAVTQSDLTAMQNTIMAAMPLAGDVVPPIDTLNGAIGTSPRYMRQDAPRPTISQRTTVTTDGSGNWSVTWSKAFVSSTPVVLPMPLNNSTPKPVCKVNTRSATTTTGSCWQQATAFLSLLGIDILITPTAFASSSIMVLGIEPSQ